MASPFIWQGNTGQISTPEQARRANAVADALAANRMKVADNGWEGLAQMASLFPEYVNRNNAASAEEAGLATAAEALAGIGPESDFSSIASALANPWLSDSQATVASALLQQNMQRNDPMYQAQLANLTAPPQADPTAGMQNYQFLVAQGVAPEEAMAMSFGAGGTTVNNIMGGEKFNDKFAEQDAAAIASASEAGIAAIRNLPRIEQLESLLNESGSGGVQNLQVLAGNLGIRTEGLDELQAAQAIINSLVPEQRQPGSGPMSDADLALFKESLPRIINSPGGNQFIIRQMKAIAQYDAMASDIANRLRQGQIDRSTAFAELQNRPHPLAEFYNSGLATPAAPAQAAPQLPPGVTIRRID
jgi:hypothetical protein